jgi:hypothetical protein
MKTLSVSEPEAGTGTEVINSLASTIQRQSAACGSFVRDAVEMEREQCALIAESEVALAAQGCDDAALTAARRIAQRIRARDERALAAG